MLCSWVYQRAIGCQHVLLPIRNAQNSLHSMPDSLHITHSISILFLQTSMLCLEVFSAFYRAFLKWISPWFYLHFHLVSLNVVKWCNRTNTSVTLRFGINNQWNHVLGNLVSVDITTKPSIFIFFFRKTFTKGCLAALGLWSLWPTKAALL